MSNDTPPTEVSDARGWTEVMATGIEIPAYLDFQLPTETKDEARRAFVIHCLMDNQNVIHPKWKEMAPELTSFLQTGSLTSVSMPVRDSLVRAAPFKVVV